MGKSAPSAPQAPDPRETAEAQYEFNSKAFQDVLRQGTLNQSGPSGSVGYTRDPTTGMPTGVNTNFDPALGGVYNTVLGAAGNQANLLPTGAFDPHTDSQGIRDAYVNAGLSNVQGLWDRQDNERNVTYAERGIPMGSELYTNAEREVGEGRNRYLSDLSNAAWQAGANEEQRQFGNQLTQYNLPGVTLANTLNTGTGLLGMLPGANPLPIQNLQPGNYADTANRNYATDVALYNQQLANQSAGLGNFLRFGGNVLGSYMMMPSDERLKEDIEPIGELHDGQEPLPIYEWSYKGDPERHVGPMAQDLAETNPELVAEHPSGYLMINVEAPTRPSLAALLRHGMAA